MIRKFAIVAVPMLVFFLSASAVFGATYNKRNMKDQYRWPWQYDQTWTISQGQFNGGSGTTDTHTVAKKLEHAIDFYYSPISPVWAAREGVASCEDWRAPAYKFGFAHRVVHGSDSDFYAHANVCYIPAGTSVPVAQGRHISYTATTGQYAGDFGDHVHFMRTTNTSSTYSASVTLEGISSFPHPTVVGQTATSDNLADGYSLPPVNWEPAIHDKAYSLGLVGRRRDGVAHQLDARTVPGHYLRLRHDAGVVPVRLYRCQRHLPWWPHSDLQGGRVWERRARDFQAHVIVYSDVHEPRAAQPADRHLERQQRRHFLPGLPDGRQVLNWRHDGADELPERVRNLQLE